MAPPKNPNNFTADVEQEFAIRKLVDLCANLTTQVEKNTNQIQSLREDILVMKTKWAMFAAFAGLVGGGVGVIVKLIWH